MYVYCNDFKCICQQFIATSVTRFLKKTHPSLPLQESRSEASLERRWIRSCDSMMKNEARTCTLFMIFEYV